MTVKSGLMTADELLRLPDDDLRHELIRGVLTTMTPPGWQHGKLTSRIDRSLGTFVEQHGLGEVATGEPGFRLAENPDTVRAPDVAFIQRDRLPTAAAEPGFFRGAPDLAVEVISPSDLYTEVDEKVAEWLEHGTRLVLVVNPRRRTVAVHRPDRLVRILGTDDTLDGEEVVPGWTLPVRDLFANR
jgi:Uma2 family endonuclease